MKAHNPKILIVLICLLVCSKASAREAEFLKLGREYVVEFVAPAPIASLRSGSVVKIVESGKGGWYKVQYRRDAWDENEKKAVRVTETVWLNFDLVLMVKEIDAHG